MKSSYELKVIQPCHMPWQEMAEVGNGRYCQKCDKILSDLRFVPDDQIVEIIKRQGEHPCGIFRRSQVQRPLQERQHSLLEKLHSLARLSFVPLLFLSSLRSQAQQTNSNKVTASQMPINGDQSQRPRSDSAHASRAVKNNMIVIKGMLVDEIDSSKRVLSYATVRIPELGIVVQCDRRGAFTLLVPDTALQMTLSAECNYLFYEPKRVPLDMHADFTVIKMHFDEKLSKARLKELEMQGQVTEDEVVVGLVAAPPKKWYEFWKKR